MSRRRDEAWHTRQRALCATLVGICGGERLAATRVRVKGGIGGSVEVSVGEGGKPFKGECSHYVAALLYDLAARGVDVRWT